MHIHTKSLMNNQVTDIGEADRARRNPFHLQYLAWNPHGGHQVRDPHGMPVIVFATVDTKIHPLKTIYTMPPALPYQPVRCRQPNCGAILNPYW